MLFKFLCVLAAIIEFACNICVLHMLLIYANMLEIEEFDIWFSLKKLILS